MNAERKSITSFCLRVSAILLFPLFSSLGEQRSKVKGKVKQHTEEVEGAGDNTSVHVHAAASTAAEIRATHSAAAGRWLGWFGFPGSRREGRIFRGQMILAARRTLDGISLGAAAH
jgi:hypothetical protein